MNRRGFFGWLVGGIGAAFGLAATEKASGGTSRRTSKFVELGHLGAPQLLTQEGFVLTKDETIVDLSDHTAEVCVEAIHSDNNVIYNSSYLRNLRRRLAAAYVVVLGSKSYVVQPILVEFLYQGELVVRWYATAKRVIE